jgi:hypothetical protein
LLRAITITKLGAPIVSSPALTPIPLRKEFEHNARPYEVIGATDYKTHQPFPSISLNSLANYALQKNPQSVAIKLVIIKFWTSENLQSVAKLVGDEP